MNVWCAERQCSGKLHKCGPLHKLQAERVTVVDSFVTKIEIVLEHLVGGRCEKPIFNTLETRYG